MIVDGRASCADGRHVIVDVAARADEAIAGRGGVSALVIDDIGLLVTGEPSLGEGPLGLVRDAALVIEGERVAASSPPAPPRTSASMPPAAA